MLAAPLFAVTIGLGAFLLFQVQFILGKQILPWFGGVPGVWTTCMLFFQVLLLLGYAYAHLIAGGAGTGRRRARLHVAALALALGSLLAAVGSWPAPIIPSASWRPGAGEDPIAAILGLLLVAIGLPYLVLSATGPLVQSWFSRCFPGRSPYRLYALSNLGSLLGLVTYPLLFEPRLRLAEQGWWWSAGFAVFVVACAGCALLGGRAPPAPEAAPAHDELAAPPARAQRGLWFGLTMVASVLLLATTNQITLEVAVIPFLWMAPLALYLMSFILCFEYERSYLRGVWIPLLFAGAAISVAVLRIGVKVQMLVQLGVHLGTLFAACMVCHGEVVRRKPAPRHLTAFYLHVAAGGAAGGLFAGVLAPALFRDLWELPLALLAACGFAVAVVLRAARARPEQLRDGGRRLLRLLAPAYLVALAIALGHHVYTELDPFLRVERSFFGVLRVDREVSPSGKPRLRLRHGRILHGLQFTDPDLARLPTTYYGAGTAVDLAIRHHPRRARAPMRLGFVGLGAGTLAAHAAPGDTVRFYEIDPDVVALSTGPSPIFTYLRDCRGDVEIALGDARVNLEREPAQQFDLLALDAFSSDSIPVHLITLEAAQLYLRHLAPDGILAIHISNRHLYLEPVVRGLAVALGLTALRIDNPAKDDIVWRSEWMLLARNPAALLAPEILRAASPPAADQPYPLWTDAFSNLLEVFRG
jgi:hypothetical protein